MTLPRPLGFVNFNGAKFSDLRQGRDTALEAAEAYLAAQADGTARPPQS